MTAENMRENIKEELARAAKFLEAAKLLAERGYYNDAVSRLYYFLFHSVKALLLSKAIEPKSHEGAIRLLGLHFVKPGDFLPRDSHILSRLMKYREEADYNPSYDFTSADFHELESDSLELHTKVVVYLKQMGHS